MNKHFKDPLKPKHHPVEHRSQPRRDNDGNLVNTLVGGVVALALVKELGK